MMVNLLFPLHCIENYPGDTPLGVPMRRFLENLKSVDGRKPHTPSEVSVFLRVPLRALIPYIHYILPAWWDNQVPKSTELQVHGILTITSHFPLAALGT